MRATRTCAVLLGILFVASLAPLTIPAAAEGTTVTICCGSTEADLYLIGENSNAAMTLFNDDLISEERVTIETAITETTEVYHWDYSPGWGGGYPDATWQFTIPYEVNNAGGVHFNATLEVQVGSKLYTGETSPGTYLPSGGTGELEIPVNVESGVLGGGDTFRITLKARSLIFSIPAADASIDLIWGTPDYLGKIQVDIPLLDMDMAPPLVEGRSVHIPVTFRSGMGTRVLSAYNLSLSIGGQIVSTSPVPEMDGPDVRATWTWIADSSLPDGGYTANVSMTIQQGGQTMQGEASWQISFGSSGNTGGVYYPAEEPLQSDGSGSPLEILINAELDTQGNDLVLSRTTNLEIHSTQARWLRWGLTNIGNSSLPQSSAWSRFTSGGISEEMRNNHIVDEEETQELSSQLQQGRLMSFLSEGLFLEGDELLGGKFSSFQTIDVRIDVHGDQRVFDVPVTLRISTTQVLEDGNTASLVRDFIASQPIAYWKDVTLDLSMTTSPDTALAMVKHDVDDATLEVSHYRWFSSESLSVHGEEIQPGSSLSITIQPTSMILYSPFVLFALCISGLIIGLFLSIKMSRGKARLALALEWPLGFIIIAAYVMAFPLETLGVLTLGSGGLWILTAAISPRKLDSLNLRGASPDLPELPTIDCPRCSTINPVVSQERPLRLPCGGCGIVLKIVD